MDLLLLKLIFLGGTFLVCLLAGVIPVALLHSNRIPWHSATAVKVIRGLMAFSLGVFFAIAFVGLLPSVQYTEQTMETALHVRIRYPLAEVTSLAGLFLFWLVAELTRRCQEGQDEPQEHLRLQESRSESEQSQETNNYLSLASCHDLGPAGGAQSTSLFSLLLIVVGLSIKSVLEGVTIGSLARPDLVVQLGSAKLVHELICTSVMALNLASACQRSPGYYSYLAVALFAVVNAGGIGVGIGVGTVTSSAGVVTKFVLQSLAAGAMLYVVLSVFVQMNQNLQPDDLSSAAKFVCVLGGFLLFAVVRAMHSLVIKPRAQQGHGM